MNKIIIPLEGLPSLNEHDKANRGNKYSGASMKKKATHFCQMYVQKAMNEGFEVEKQPMDLRFDWYLKNKRKDKDNVSFAKKYIFDGMIDAGLLNNDGWHEVGDWLETFHLDKEFERVEIYEVLS